MDRNSVRLNLKKFQELGTGGANYLSFILGHRHYEMKVVKSRRVIKVSESFGYSTEVPFDELFSHLSSSTLHELFQPLIERRLLWEMENDQRNQRQLAAAQRVRIKKRDNLTCAYCQEKGDDKYGPDRKFWHLDHLDPRIGGGNDDDANLVLSCQTCNLKKGARELDEFLSNGGMRIVEEA